MRPAGKRTLLSLVGATGAGAAPGNGAGNGQDEAVAKHAAASTRSAQAEVGGGGEELWRCSGVAGPDTRGTTDHRLPCSMTGGSSGGGWITGGVLNSVNSFGYQGERDVMYGPTSGTSGSRSTPPPAPAEAPAEAISSLGHGEARLPPRARGHVRTCSSVG